VDTGIGTPGAGEVDGFGCHAPERTLGHLLQRRHSCLRLPAGIGAAVVLNSDGNSQPQPPTKLLSDEARRRRQKPRLLPAATKLLSEKAPQATFSH
jgi:hypothetical protein